jgi:hypothetical protein
LKKPPLRNGDGWRVELPLALAALRGEVAHEAIAGIAEEVQRILAAAELCMSFFNSYKVSFKRINAAMR